MSSSTPFDGKKLYMSYPTSDEPHGNDYQEHQNTKKAINYLIGKEHIAPNDSTGLDQDGGGGEHENGAAVAYQGTDTPGYKPDGVTALGDNTYDKGRLWIDTNYSPAILRRWAGTTWSAIGVLIANNTFLTMIDAAGTGTVNVIKVNASDDIEIGDGTPNVKPKNLVIENTTSDPTGPVSGQIWFRTDV